MPEAGSRDSRASTSSSIRASVLNVCIQLGALDDNSRIADLMFGESTDDSYDYFDEDHGRGRALDRKIRFVSPQGPPVAVAEPERTVSSISSRLAAKLGFGSKRRRSGEEEAAVRTEESAPPPSPKAGRRSFFNVVHRRSRSGSVDSTARSPARKDSSRSPVRRLTKPHYVRSRSEDWEEVVLPTSPMEFQDNVFLGRTPKKLTARPLSSYQHSDSDEKPLPSPRHESLHLSMPRPRNQSGRGPVPSSFKTRPASLHFPKLARSSSLA